jgi:hypothetical protein
MKKNALGISLLILALLLTACADSDQPIEDGVLRLTFDGESCIYEGPTLLKAGPVTLHFYNDSDEEAAMDFVRHTGDKTIQDAIEYIGDEPSTVIRAPWARTLGVNYKRVPAGESFSWDMDLEAGIHTMVCIRAVNRGVWFGTGLIVED